MSRFAAREPTCGGVRGDALFTGTPDGVGPIQAGDRIESSITGIGHMQADVVSR